MSTRQKPRTPGKAPAHRSVSQLETLFGCGQQYAFKYLEGIREPGSLPKAKGSAVHGAAQANFQQKVETDFDVPADDFRDLAAATFEAEMRGEVLFSPEEQSVGVKKAVAKQKDATVKLAEFYHATVSPDYRPVLVEHEFSIDLPSLGTSLIGFIDLVDLTGRIIDTKTSKRAKSQNDADTSLQLTAYAAAREKEKRPAPSLILDTCVQTAGGKTYRQKLTTHRDQADYAALAARMVAAEKIIQAGAFMPAPAKAWWCSPSWCGFWAQCPFVNRKRATGSE